MAHTRLLAIALLAAVPCLAAARECSDTSSVSDAHLQLTIKDGRTSFQQGEIVPLVLSYASAATGRYSADTRNYDRSGRLEIETYCIEPTAPDPLESYFENGSFMGGGLGGSQPLGSAPHVFEANLNEYATLAPGRYRLYAVSGRVYQNTDKARFWGDPVTLRSNKVEFTVKRASAAWQKQQLEGAIQTLARTPYKENQFPADQTRIAVASRIRYLNTPDSAKALAALLTTRDSRDPVQWEILFGLYGSPYRMLVLQAMHDQIALPSRAITEDFLDTLADLEITADSAWDASPSDAKDWANYHRRREARVAELHEADASELLSALPRKTGSARAVSAAGLLLSERSNADMARDARRLLIESWSDLPAKQREDMIDAGWDLIKGPEMVPLLAAMVEGPTLPSREFGEDGKNAALRHLAELDPVAAAPLMLKELETHLNEPSIALLALLPASEMGRALAPAIDRIARDHPAAGDFDRIDRFAGAEALPAVKAYYDTHRGQFPCEDRAQILHYMVRIEPEFGVSKVTNSLHSTKEGGCVTPSVLSDLAERLPAVESIAIEALADPDPEVARDAAQALGKWGSHAAEAPLWFRLKTFHDQWAGRAGELARKDELRRNPQAVLEENLVYAIGTGTNWLLRPEGLLKLRQLTLTERSRETVDGFIKDWQSSPEIEVEFDGNTSNVKFSLGPLRRIEEQQFKTRLAQFPNGTTIKWKMEDPRYYIVPRVTRETLESIYERLRAEAEKNGVTLVKTAVESPIEPE